MPLFETFKSSKNKNSIIGLIVMIITIFLIAVATIYGYSKTSKIYP